MDEDEEPCESCGSSEGHMAGCASDPFNWDDPLDDDDDDDGDGY